MKALNLEFQPVFTLISNILDQFLSDKSKIIVEKRYGLGYKKHTLQEIAVEVGVSRERIRQISSKAIFKLRNNLYMNNIDVVGLLNLTNCHFLPANFLDGVHSTGNMLNLSMLLVETFPDKIALLDHDFFIIPLIAKKNSLTEATVANISNLVVELKSVDKPAEIIPTLSSYQIHKDWLAAIKGLVYDSTGEYFSHRSNPNLTINSKSKKILEIIKQKGKPVSVWEIMEVTTFTEPQIRVALEKDSSFVNVGPSFYALKEWGYIPGKISDVAVSLLERAGEPMHISAIVKAVKFQRICKEPSVLALIKADERIVQVDPSYYALKSQGYELANLFHSRKISYDVILVDAITELLGSDTTGLSIKEIISRLYEKYQTRVSTKFPTVTLALRKLHLAKKISVQKTGRQVLYYLNLC